MADKKDCLVYCIASGRKTYVGKTNNFARRLRQHNGHIVGGARYTRGSNNWRPIFHVKGLTKREALQLEWAIKHKRVPGVSGVEGRRRTLARLMTLERWTRNAPLLSRIRHRIRIQTTFP